MKAYLVCEPDLGCLTVLADTRAKAKYKAASEMGLDGTYEFESIYTFGAWRVPKYDDAKTDRELHDRYYTDHDPETGELVEHDQ